MAAGAPDTELKDQHLASWEAEARMGFGKERWVEAHAQGSLQVETVI